MSEGPAPLDPFHNLQAIAKGQIPIKKTPQVVEKKKNKKPPPLTADEKKIPANKPVNTQKVIKLLAKKQVRKAQKESKAAPPTKRVKIGGKDKERDALFGLLCAYGESKVLGKYLSDNGYVLTTTRLRKLSKAKLQAELDEIELLLNNRSNGSLVDEGIRRAMEMLERSVEARTRMKLKGTTNACFENDRWRFLLERVRLKYKIGIGSMDPIVELSLSTAQTAMLVSMHNEHLGGVPQTDLYATTNVEPMSE